jgi:hypothetical protein
MKLSEQVNSLLAPFQIALEKSGADFSKTVRDMASFLGSQSVTTIEGGLKAQSGLTIARKDSHKMSLPPNNPLSHLFWFGVRLAEVAEAGKLEIQSSLPRSYANYLEGLKLRTEASTPETPAPAKK